MVESYIKEDRFLVQHMDFSLREQVNYPNGGYSNFYDNGVDMVIIDENICEHKAGESVFSYMLITDKQNNYMHKFKRVFRFLGYSQKEVDKYLLRDEITLSTENIKLVSDRGEQADVSPLEFYYEKSFSISEGWDYPDLGILVMARPTLSKVLYLQQIGRGLRKTDSKKNVIVVDVVDEYGAMVKACNMHSIFANPFYVPFGDITKTDYVPGALVVIDGIEEHIERITEVDINSFEDKYGNYLSQEQVAREYFVSTGTVTGWIKKGKIKPSVGYKFGSKSLYLFSPEDVEKYRKELKIKIHNDNTIKEDFFEFLEERDYSLSYKMPFMLSIIKHIDTIGDAKIEEVLDDYIAFYQDRLNRGLQVDRSTCPYNEKMLQDRKAVCRNMLTNPFEKFERKRFLYYSKDLSIISMNHALFSQMEKADWERVKMQLQDALKNYYSEMGGI